MTDTPVTYFALLAGGRTPDNPSGLVRRRHTTPPTDEVFTRDLTWQPTEYLVRYRLGHTDTDHVEVSEQEATAILDRWRARWPTQDALDPEWRDR